MMSAAKPAVLAWRRSLEFSAFERPRRRVGEHGVAAAAIGRETQAFEMVYERK